MRLTIMTASLFALLQGLPAVAQEAEEDPGDALNECLAKPVAETTQGMVECLDAAYIAWDKELNAVYKQVIETLDPRSAELLKEAQRAWIAYRDAERAFWQGPWTEDRGTMIRLTLGDANIAIVGDRVNVLRGYLPGP